MNKWKITAGLLLVFLCGVVVGAVGTGGFVRHMLHSFGEDKGDHPMKLFVMKNIEARLHLDTATMDKISQDMDIAMEHTRDMRKELSPRIQKIMNDFMTRTEAYLNPEQHEKLVQLMDDFKNHRMDKLEGPGWLPPPPPPPWVALPPEPK